MKAQIPYRLRPIDITSEFKLSSGRRSTEESAQKQRDRTVLAVFYRQIMPPNNPMKEFDELYATKN